MTEAEWQQDGTEYLSMLIYLRGEVELRSDGMMPGLHCGAGYLADGEAKRTSARKLRLFAAAICQRWWTLPLDEVSRNFLRVYDQFANDAACWDDVVEVGAILHEAARRGEQPSIGFLATSWVDTPCGVADLGATLAHAVADHNARDSVAITCKDATEEEWWDWGWGCGPPDPLWQSTRKAVQDEYPPLLRDVIGNPFRPSPVIAPTWLAWNDATILNIARGIYQETAFHRLPILADALEDAGCADAAILSHLRGPGPHVRGCWAVDLILGKS